MSGGDKQLELEALAAVGEMLLFDQARGNPEEAARILRCARLFARSEDAARRLSELCNEAGSDTTWRENIVEELQDREDLKAAEAAMQRIREGGESAAPVEDVMGRLEAGYAAQAQAEQEPYRYQITQRPPTLAAAGGCACWNAARKSAAGCSRCPSTPRQRTQRKRPATPMRTPWPRLPRGWHRGAKIERRGRGLRPRQRLTITVYEGDNHGFRHYGGLHQRAART